VKLATAFLRPKKNRAHLESQEARPETRSPRLHPETVRTDDTFVVSYPKSGNTWQRFLIANLVRPHEPISFLNINRIVPDVYQTAEEELVNHPSPRFLKSHDAFTPRFPRSIYITRDPRSVAVSMFHFGMARGKFQSDESLDTLVRAFIRGAVCGKLIRAQIRSWAENVMSWVSQVDQGNSSVLLLRYEDLKADTLGELRRVANFLRITASDAVLRSAVENSSFERLQEFEREFDKMYARKDWVAGSRFIRKAAVDEWKEVLSPEQSEMICAAFERPMLRMGYV
jgi:hypothetical protein